MKRTPLNRKSPMKRTGMKPSKRATTKSAAAAREWQAVRQVVIDRDQVCQAKEWEHVCGMGEHVHHVKRRSQGGENVPGNLVLLCGIAHDHVHGNPAWSRSVGLLA